MYCVCVYNLFICFEIASCYAFQAGLELTIELGLAFASLVLQFYRRAPCFALFSFEM